MDLFLKIKLQGCGWPGGVSESAYLELMNKIEKLLEGDKNFVSCVKSATISIEGYPPITRSRIVRTE